MKLASKMLDHQIEPGVSAENAVTQLQPEKLQLMDAVPTDTAILTNVLCGTIDGKELILHPAYSPPQQTMIERPTTRTKRNGRLNILAMFLMKTTVFMVRLFSKRRAPSAKKEPTIFHPQMSCSVPQHKVEVQTPSMPLLLEAPKVDSLISNRLTYPKQEEDNNVLSHWFRNQFNIPLYNWSVYNNPYTPEQMIFVHAIAQTFNEIFRTSLSSNESLVLTTFDFKSVLAMIKRLKRKVGLAELSVMILLSLIVSKKLYKEQGCKSASSFYVRYAEAMGMSSSRARDYSIRGLVFMKYRKDILEGVGCVPGIPLEEVANFHLSKLTIFNKAVEKYGKEEALMSMKTLSFRDFQDKIADRKPKDKMVSVGRKNQFLDPCYKLPKIRLRAAFREPPDVNKEQKAMILEMNLSPSEKRLLHIIAKGGIVHLVAKLSEEQLKEVETRIHKRRVDILEKNLKMASIGFTRKSYDPQNPLAISDDLFKLDNFNDIVLRIREGLALTVPARRVIAILLHRIYTKDCGFYWQQPREGISYTSFEDFVMGELGMGYEYREYIAVGEALRQYPNFLYHLSDMDTEDVFFKLKYLPKAINSHYDNECLVLARLRSLTVREFKMFSELPNFEVTFSKKLKKKQIALFKEFLTCGRNKERMVHPIFNDYIEAYSKGEFGMIDEIVRNVIAETETRNSEPSLPSDETTADKLGLDEVTPRQIACSSVA